MGFFSGKTRRYGGVSNSRMYKNNEYPRAIKDSSASYISDYPHMTNPSETSMADYNALGMEQSIVPAFKKAVRYASSETFRTARQVNHTILEIGDTDLLINAIVDEMHLEFPNNLIVNYILLEDLDYAHLTRQFLIDDYNYSPISNGLTIEGQDYWLADAVLYLNTRKDQVVMGNSFTSTRIPGRDFDNTRPYTPWVYREDIPDIRYWDKETQTYKYRRPRDYYRFKEKAELSLIEKYTHNFYEVHEEITTYTEVIDPDTGEISIEESHTTTHPEIIDIVNNLPTDITLHEFQTILIEETHEIITDTLEEYRVRITKRYDSSYYPNTLIKGTHTINFDEYFMDLPTIPEMGDWQDEDYSEEVDEYIDEVENEETSGDIFSSSYIISIGFSYINSDGDKVVTYRTLVDNRKDGTTLGLISERYDNIIWENTVINEIGFLMPSLHLRYANKNIEKESTEQWIRDAYPIYKKYANKLGIKYHSFLDNMYDDMLEEAENKDEFKDNWSKVRTVSLVFGIDVNTKDEFLYKYIYEFFANYIVEEVLPTKPDLFSVFDQKIRKTDTLSNEGFSWRGVRRYLVELKLYDEVTEEYKADTYYNKENFIEEVEVGGGGIIEIIIKANSSNECLRLFKQISPTHCEVYEVIGFVRTVQITDKTSVRGFTEEADNADHLIPLNPSILFRCYKSFKDKEAAIYKSMYIEFLSYVEVKEKWYQTGLFKMFTIAVGAAIGFFFPPAGVAAMSLSTAAMVAVSTLISIAINIGISIAIKLIVKAFGLENSRLFAILVAIAAIAFGAYNALGSMANLFKTFQLFFNKITTYMVQAASGLLNEVNMLIGVEMQEEAKTQKEKLKELESHAENMFGYLVDDTQDFYGINRNYISPMIKLGSNIDQIMAEATNYNRMADVIDYIHTYPDYIISLPTLEETIQAMQQNGQQ